MKKVFIGFVFAMVMALSAVVLYAQESVAGAWTMSVQGMSLQFVLAQDGQKVSGTLESPHGSIRLTGEFSKGKLVLSGAPTQDHPVEFSATAKLAADGSLAGSLSVNQMEMTFTAVHASGR